MWVWGNPLKANSDFLSMGEHEPASGGGGEYSARGLGDPQTWAEVVEVHYDRVFRTALGQMRRHNLAEEVTQETFIRAYEKRHLFDGTGSLASWLYRITVNLSRDTLRRENLRGHAELSEATEHASDEDDPAETVHRKHACQVLRDELSRMPEPMRRAFEHTVVHGYSYKEAAEIEGVSEGTIASRVSRTRSALARKCSEWM